jgi:hypothetical protein
VVTDIIMGYPGRRCWKALIAGQTDAAAIADLATRTLRRARHVLSENQRVLDFVVAVRDCDFVRAGHMLTVSQNSMRDDFESTTEHINLIADTAVTHNALGARMTGGGFGGCVIALARAETADRAQQSVRKTVADDHAYPRRSGGLRDCEPASRCQSAPPKTSGRLGLQPWHRSAAAPERRKHLHPRPFAAGQRDARAGPACDIAGVGGDRRELTTSLTTA